MPVKFLMMTCLAVAALSACAAKTVPGQNGSNANSGGLGASNPLPLAGSSGTVAVGDPFGAGTVCTTFGEKRDCCGGMGTQTCNGTAEFLTWSACLDPKGAAVSCKYTQPSGCGVGEFATQCDAGVDSGTPHHCGEGEFGPSCTNPPPPSLCQDKSVNTEPEILAGYYPANGAAVGTNEQIKVWVNDERPAYVALNEQIDPATGAIIMPGDRTGKAPDGYLWEPALYIAPQTAENGGVPHFPQYIKGWYNNKPPYVRGAPTPGAQVSGMDPAPAGARLPERYTTEDIWDVTALGLKPGTYTGEFVIHDGDRDRAIGCVTITITN